jgi:acyl-CoA synthetase (AMP-forming)/AMP-acid ligase II
VFPVKHLRALMERWSAPRYLNVYGPTETNGCTCYEVPATLDPGRTAPLPIGRMCSGDRGMVVDEALRPVAPGTEGELLVAGPSVMRGYWNLPERTARAFHVDADGTRWYRTGDLVTDAGAEGFVFAGRRDRMVKRRGYRVELGEIEAGLYKHPVVKEAAVVAIPDEEAGVKVKAYLSSRDNAHPSLIALKRFCAENLPLYMIPDSFSWLDALPKTSTDKVDYQRLVAQP